MKKYKNWVCHRNKIPIDPNTGQAAKSNDPNTWGTYEQAKMLMECDKSISGLGFMFSNTPYVGIDIDHCIQNKKFSELAREIITTLQSYTEISPSGTGVHIICKGKIEAGRKNSTLGLEMYDSGRYFTVTGRVLKNYQNIVECQNQIDSICEKYFEVKKSEKAPKQQSISHFEDQKLIEIAIKSQNGGKFGDLYAGNWQNYYKSQSEADIALCNMLAFWTACDFEQMDRIFRTSGLMRNKWNEMHGINTYGDMTITKAIDDCNNTFEPSQTRDFNGINTVETPSKPCQNESENTQNQQENEQNGQENEENGQKNEENGQENEENPHFLDRFHKFNAKRNITGVFDAEIMEYIIQTEHIIIVGDCVYLYQNGVYLIDGKGSRVKNIIQNLIYKEFQNSRTINRVYELIVMQPCLRKNYSQVNQYPDTCINFQNGMLDVNTMELLPHSPQYYSMNQIPHDFKNITKKDLEKYPYSQQFLKTSLNIPDIDTLFQYMGICLTHTTVYQIFLLLKGEGANGKSLLIDMFNAVIGEQNISSLSMEKLTQRFFSSQLVFKLCNTCADISKVTIEDDAELKKIIGGDMIQTEFKGKDSFSFRPYAKMLFSANRFPHVNDRSNGFKRRLRVIEMNKNTKGKDIYLKEKTLQELEFWVYMAVQGLKKVLVQHDVYESENSKRVKENIHKESDSVYAFILDCLLPVEGMNIKRSEMFKEYDKYCTKNERIRVKKKTFFEEMTAKGFTPKRKDKEGYIYEGYAFTIWENKEEIPFF